MKRTLALMLLAGFIFSLTGITINVPADYGTIQSAINNSSNGDVILVADGIYYENINFLGKSITVASHYYLDNDTDHILNTVINGSQPDDPEFASCVMLLSGEDANTTLQGFTLTGGQGTAFEFAVNAVYKEGGGIITYNSSAVIKNNLIIENEASVIAGTLGGGGGGISAIYSNPQILNNVIMRNSASYAAGLVLNWSGGVVKNNIVYANYGGEDYGTGGVMVWDVGPATAVVENNTIVGNISNSTAGGLSVTNSSALIRNNIIWGNQQVIGLQVTGINNSTFEYCCLEDEMNGEGHIFDYPEFTDENFLLNAFSDCIDAGNPDSEYNDVEDPGNPGSALFPAQGYLQNDIGAYGGEGAEILADFEHEELIFPELIEFSTDLTVGETEVIEINIKNMSTKVFEINNIDAMDPNLQYEDNDFEFLLKQFKEGILTYSWTPQTEGELSSFIFIYHNFEIYDNPILIPVSGNAQVTGSSDEVLPDHNNLELTNYPNPFNPTTTISCTLNQGYAEKTENMKLVISNLKGQIVKIFTITNERSWRLEQTKYMFSWDGTDTQGRPVASGVYQYRLMAGNRVLGSKKCLLLK